MESKNYNYNEIRVMELKNLKENYISELMQINSNPKMSTQQLKQACEEFKIFIDKWQFWLDKQSKNHLASDWQWLYELINDIKIPNSNRPISNRHIHAIALLAPNKIMKISLFYLRNKYEI